MTKKPKWKRIRPGLYRILDTNGLVCAEIERGAETGMWWVTVWNGEDWICDRWATLKAAKAWAERKR